MGAYAKALGAGISGAAVLILVWIAGLLHIDVPVEIAIAFQTLISGAAVYFLPNKPPAG